jgi:hypothetical protein
MHQSNVSQPSVFFRRFCLKITLAKALPFTVSHGDRWGACIKGVAMRRQETQFNLRELVLCLILILSCGVLILAIKLMAAVAQLCEIMGAVAMNCIAVALEILDQPLALVTLTILLFSLLLLAAFNAYQASRRVTVGPREIAVVRRYWHYYAVLPQGHYVLPFGAWVERRMSLQAWHETRRFQVLT